MESERRGGSSSSRVRSAMEARKQKRPLESLFDERGDEKRLTVAHPTSQVLQLLREQNHIQPTPIYHVPQSILRDLSRDDASDLSRCVGTSSDGRGEGGGDEG